MLCRTSTRTATLSPTPLTERKTPVGQLPEPSARIISLCSSLKPIVSQNAVSLKISLDHQKNNGYNLGKFRLRALSDFPKSTDEIKGEVVVPQTIATILQKDSRSDTEAKTVRDYYLRTNATTPFESNGWRHLSTKEAIDLEAIDFDQLDEKAWKAVDWKDNKGVTTTNGYAYRRIDSTPTSRSF